MSDDSRRVLELLAQGKITVDEADQLLKALKSEPAGGETSPVPDGVDGATKPRFVRIHVHKPGTDGREDKDVNIRVPLSLVRGGMRLGTMIPGWQQWMGARVRERADFDLGQFDPAVIESLLSQQGEINIDVNNTGERVRITLE